MYGIEWLPVAAALTVVGIVVAVVLWRRVGAGTGLKALGIALFPMAVVLVGLQGVLRELWTALSRFVSGLLFSPQIWFGIGLGVLGVLLIILGDRLTVRRLKRAGDGGTPAVGGRSNAAGTSRAGATPAKQVGSKPAAKSGTPAEDDGMDEIDAILKRHGIS